MTEAAHEYGTADDGFHEIHLSGKQLVFLFIATTIVSVLIFLLGVMVGRGVPVQRQAADQFTEPAAPAPASQPPSAPPVVAESDPPPAEPPAPADDAEELSYRKRLESEAVAAESLKPRAAAPRPVATTPPAAAASVPSSSQPVAGTPQPGVWVVQVHALRDRNVASGIVQRLVKKGYPAFLVAAGPPTGAYKVQVGRFKDKEEAQRFVERLKKEEQYKPWITR